MAKHPHCVIVIENPVGKLHHMPLMKELVECLGLERVEVHYCHFGSDQPLKPTHLWTNLGDLARFFEQSRCRGCKRHIDVRGNSAKQFSKIPERLARILAKKVSAHLISQNVMKTKAASP